MGCCTSEEGGLESERRGGITSKETKETKDPSGMGKYRTGPRPKLMYFGIYGKAEQLRMMLNHAGVQFEDIHLTREEFAVKKENGELPGGQVPIWIDEEGRTFNQTNAIHIMLGKKYGYYPEDPWDAYHDDWALANFGDIWVPEWYRKFFSDELDDETVDEIVAKFEKWNQTVEGKLSELGVRKFIGGRKPSVGDFVTFAIYANVIFN